MSSDRVGEKDDHQDGDKDGGDAAVTEAAIAIDGDDAVARVVVRVYQQAGPSGKLAVDSSEDDSGGEYSASGDEIDVPVVETVSSDSDEDEEEASDVDEDLAIAVVTEAEAGGEESTDEDEEEDEEEEEGEVWFGAETPTPCAPSAPSDTDLSPVQVVASAARYRSVIPSGGEGTGDEPEHWPTPSDPSAPYVDDRDSREDELTAITAVSAAAVDMDFSTTTPGGPSAPLRADANVDANVDESLSDDDIVMSTSFPTYLPTNEGCGDACAHSYFSMVRLGRSRTADSQPMGRYWHYETVNPRRAGCGARLMEVATYGSCALLCVLGLVTLVYYFSLYAFGDPYEMVFATSLDGFWIGVMTVTLGIAIFFLLLPVWSVATRTVATTIDLDLQLRVLYIRIGASSCFSWPVSRRVPFDRIASWEIQTAVHSVLVQELVVRIKGENYVSDSDSDSDSDTGSNTDGDGKGDADPDDANGDTVTLVVHPMKIAVPSNQTRVAVAKIMRFLTMDPTERLDHGFAFGGMAEAIVMDRWMGAPLFEHPTNTGRNTVVGQKNQVWTSEMIERVSKDAATEARFRRYWGATKMTVLMCLFPFTALSLGVFGSVFWLNVRLHVDGNHFEKNSYVILILCIFTLSTAVFFFVLCGFSVVSIWVFATIRGKLATANWHLHGLQQLRSVDPRSFIKQEGPLKLRRLRDSVIPKLQRCFRKGTSWVCTALFVLSFDILAAYFVSGFLTATVFVQLVPEDDKVAFIATGASIAGIVGLFGSVFFIVAVVVACLMKRAANRSEKSTLLKLGSHSDSDPMEEELQDLRHGKRVHEVVEKEEEEDDNVAFLEVLVERLERRKKEKKRLLKLVLCNVLIFVGFFALVLFCAAVAVPLAMSLANTETILEAPTAAT